MDIVEPDLKALRAHGWREAELAADMIARLQAENERLQKELLAVHDLLTKWSDANIELQAENERLREIWAEASDEMERLLVEIARLQAIGTSPQTPQQPQSPSEPPE